MRAMHFTPFKKLSKKQRIKILLSAAGFFGALCLFIIAMNFRGITVKAPAEELFQDKRGEEPFRHPFTGDAISDEFPGTRVACVMVENSVDAWPLSGLEGAFLVIEAPVEGSIPRFMACYEEGVDVDKIGPVRSARPYYVSWASGFGAVYAHVGGSPEALALIARSNDITDLNEFWNGFSFWRDSSRYAPHNAYTSTALLWAAADRLEAGLAQAPGWTYEDSRYEKGRQPCDEITIDWMSAFSYDVAWGCNQETGTYMRYQGGVMANSAQGGLYEASNIVVMEADITSIDEVDRRHIVTEGTGNAKLCSQGLCKDGVWYKEGVDKPLQFFTSYPGQPFTFAPGKTWIEVVGDIEVVTVGDGEVGT